MAKKYSAKERKAFHMGRAWAAGKEGKRIPCPDEKTKRSFRNGVKATRERKSGGGKKPAQAQGVVAYVPSVGNCLIDGDGCILKILNRGSNNG